MGIAEASSAIILGAGYEAPNHEGCLLPPRCLLTDAFGQRVLDWILTAFHSVDITDITFVGGYRIEDIGKHYGVFKYVYNVEWETSGVLSSLYHAHDDIQGGTLISHADIVFRAEACQQLINSHLGSIRIAVDRTWAKRNANASFSQELRKNMVTLDGDQVREIGFLPPSSSIDAEFTGLIYIPPELSGFVSDFFKNEYPKYLDLPFGQAPNIRQAYITDLLQYCIAQGVPVNVIDICDQWAEMDGPEQFATFVMGTKGETLERLAHLVKRGRFCKQHIFTLFEWKEQPEQILESIKNDLAPHPIVVRSSTHMEDSWQASHAGAFESKLNIDSTNSDNVAEAINSVIASYAQNGGKPGVSNQCLVQEMVCNVVMSGVVFTYDLDSGAPYYIINYDDLSGVTDSVTSGTSSDIKTVVISRSHKEKISIPYMDSLLEVVQELETVTGCNALDIEFAIDVQRTVWVLQTRPLTMANYEQRFEVIQVDMELEGIRSFLKHRFKRVPYLFGETTVLGDMPDWNPAEMIGVHPHPLALSMYHYLITASTWRESRTNIGYNNPEPSSLMLWIAGHPYIDVRCSMNSLLPEALGDDIKEKLINYYIDKLKNHPEMHDKIEFDICITCLDFNFSTHAALLKDSGFTLAEIEEIKIALLSLTDKIVSGQMASVDELMGNIDALNKRRLEVLNLDYTLDSIPAIIAQLLDDCVRYGTMPFSILARYAFISHSLLRSLVMKDIMSLEDNEAFLGSIETIATEMACDMNGYAIGDISRETFLSKYGHLRPGTYDITSLRYDEAPDAYLPTCNESKEQQVNQTSAQSKALFAFTPKQESQISESIVQDGFTFSVTQLKEFFINSIVNRERAKFEFTKTVSDILVLIEQYGKGYGFSREEMAFLDIEQIRLWGISIESVDVAERLRKEIERGQARFHSDQRVKTPHLIMKPEDIDVMEYAASRPNYVTLKKVTAPVVVVNENTKPEELSNKIVLIEAADPGFDWIFLHNISGLITRYGGGASHMTIRAAEFGIPAAIGCGEVLFNQLSLAHTIELDCSGNRVHVT